MRSRAFGPVLVALVLVGCLAALAGAALAASAAVAIDGFRFLPQTVTVNVGETVTWTNRDPAQHTATAAGAFNTGVLAMGQSKAVQMNAAGTFEYRCEIHSAMSGTVRVVAAAAPTPVPAAPTPVPATARPPTAVPTVAPTPVPTAAPPTPRPTPLPTTTPATAGPTPSPTTTPATASPTASPTPAATTAAPTVVAQSSPSPRGDPPAPGTPPLVPPDGGPGPTLAVVAGLLAAGFVALGVYLARRR